MVSVEEAEKITQSKTKDYGTENVPFDKALGRVLAEDFKADRDIPPYNRVAMDGIAIQYEAFLNGVRSFAIKATQAAGDIPSAIHQPNECIEIMTGAALPDTADTVIRYEDLNINNGIATIQIDNIRKGQNIHFKGTDKKTNDVVVPAHQIVTPIVINIAASVGSTELCVKKLPKVVVISTGNELIDVNQIPSPYQIRSSNNYTIKAVLQQYGLTADMLHIPDDPTTTKQQIQHCLSQYDLIILCGGISMGKFDYIPSVLEKLSVQKLFHKVKQRPGKPFWFGCYQDNVLVFAFPGNPVSMFMCLYRYFLPWLDASLKIITPTIHAVLGADVTFNSSLQYFLQVKLNVNNEGQLIATPMAGNGSGDYANLTEADAFMELPLERNTFIKGEVFKIWLFKQGFR
jgi:molybdopterin molybdotransferase